MYCTQHSWTLDKFKRACIDEDGKRSWLFNQNDRIFAKGWEIEELECCKSWKHHGHAARSLLLSLRLFASNILYVEDQLGGCSNSQDGRLKLPLPDILALLSLYWYQQFFPLTWGRHAKDLHVLFCQVPCCRWQGSYHVHRQL
jgi:hypothetical protein